MSDPQENAEMPYAPEDDEIMSDVLTAAEANFLTMDGITGVGLGQTELGEDALMVYLQSADQAKTLPKTFQGLPVMTSITGDIVAN